ncbi:hypothetical protein VNO78_04492 [Psophocarpus tetragonolobus]|uniref:Uncharacterized protein n=1 Tax=Psophocarpus tetragonolobus TaxID=3891 RepID=A0AAN9XWB7_PSOTE
MPLPWNKNRVPRISQIVADLQSPKRGGSLVVETGFPTSLIDLFVKNRSRFTKHHRSKKPPPLENPDPPPPPPPPSPANPPPPPPSPEPTRVPTSQVETHDAAVSVPDPITQHSSGANLVVLVMKILVVLVFVASVKRLTVGITVSAFALLLLEYAGPRVVSFSAVESFFRKVLKKERVLVTELAELSSEGLLIDEIEVVDLEAVTDVGICYEMRSLSTGDVTLIQDCSSKVLESYPCEDVSECKIRTSRSGRFRSKMVKKLVPKKFRGSKKEKKETTNKPNEGESLSEVSSAVEEDKLEIEGDESSNTKLEEVDCGIGITCSHEKKVESIGNLGSSMVFVMIALVGLLLGRFPALGLLMTWCCLMKIVRSLFRSSHNVPMIKCSDSNS